MIDVPENILDIIIKFAVAILLGALVGTERQHKEADTEEGHYSAGIRTFSIITLFGCLSGFAATEISPFIFPAAFLAFSGLIIAGYIMASMGGEDKGTTTEFTSLLFFLIGGVVFWGHIVLASVLAVTVTTILSLKGTLHVFAERLSEEDIRAGLKFAIISIVILPLLPDKTYGPLDVLNPFNIWLMVVLISGISFLGYILLKSIGPSKGLGITGAVGGLISSTAVTLTFAKRSTETDSIVAPFAVPIVAACTIMFVRIVTVVQVLNPELAGMIYLPMGIMAAGGAIGSFFAWFRERKKVEETIDLPNPFSLKPAIQFGALYAVILLVVEFARTQYGDSGVLLASAISGLTDVDAITLTTSRLAGKSLDMSVAARAITIAAIANTALKFALIFFLGSKALTKFALVPFGLMLVTGLIYIFVA